jgi:hypothetical protein
MRRLFCVIEPQSDAGVFSLLSSILETCNPQMRANEPATRSGFGLSRLVPSRESWVGTLQTQYSPACPDCPELSRPKNSMVGANALAEFTFLGVRDSPGGRSRPPFASLPRFLPPPTSRACVHLARQKSNFLGRCLPAIHVISLKQRTLPLWPISCDAERGLGGP